jgi:hypothetical protein
VANRITLEDGPIKVEILDMHPDWAVEVMVAAQHGEPVITHLQIRPHPDTNPSDGDGVPINGLTATVTRRLSFSDIRLRALKVLSPLFQTASDGTRMIGWYEAEPGSQPTPRSTAQALGSFDPRSRAPGEKRNDYDYARIAEIYVELNTPGQRGLLKALSERLGVTPDNAAKLVYRAREKGLLMGGRQGRPGGYLSPRANELLGISNERNNPPEDPTA